MHPTCIRNVSEIYPKFNLLSIDLQSLKYCKKSKQAYIFLPILPIFIPNLSQIQPSLPISHLLKYCKNPNASQMHQKCIRNLSQIQPSLPRSQSFKYCKNQNKHTYFSLYYLYLSHIYPKFNLLSLYLTYSNTVKIPNASQMHQKCIRNLSPNSTFPQ